MGKLSTRKILFRDAFSKSDNLWSNCEAINYDKLENASQENVVAYLGIRSEGLRKTKSSVNITSVSATNGLK
jgi:hypothetical protein